MIISYQEATGQHVRIGVAEIEPEDAHDEEKIQAFVAEQTGKELPWDIRIDFDGTAELSYEDR